MYSLEEFDTAKTRVLKYILYKKRTENEVRIKFARIMQEDLLDDVIDYLKDAGYINDDEYVERQVNQICALKNLSLKEIKYKLFSKGVSKDKVEDYFSQNKEELQEYEEKAASNIVYKKSYKNEKEEIRNYLMKKGYTSESIKKAMEDY